LIFLASNAGRDALWAALIIVLIGINTISYTENHWLLITAASDAFVMTHLATRLYVEGLVTILEIQLKRERGGYSAMKPKLRALRSAIHFMLGKTRENRTRVKRIQR